MDWIVWMLRWRRARLRFAQWTAATQLCFACGRQLDGREFVCEDEACQMRALAGQAMLASPSDEPQVARRRRLRYATPAIFYEEPESCAGLFV